VPAYVEREFSFMLDGDRIRGRWDRVDIELIDADPGVDADSGGADDGPGARRARSADVVNPTMGILGRERVTITDYKSTDVRDPIRARKRARDSLQLQIYAMGYEAMTGRLPDAVALHFLDSGLIGKVPVEPKRLAKARDRIATAAAGIRRRDYAATPDATACGWCPYRDICPSSVARAGR
jgi:DNA helicase-2/ATP-dependent DNA helicase PcrA